MGLGHVDQQGGHDDVHSLAVSDVGVDPAVGGQDSPETSDALLALEAGVFRETAVEVFLDLVYGERHLAGILGQGVGIESRSLEPQVDGTGRQLPRLSSQPVRQSDADQLVEGGLADQCHIAAVVSQVLSPQPHLGAVSKLLGVAGILEDHAEPGVGRRGILLIFGAEEVFRVAFGHGFLELPYVPHAGTEPFLQAVAKSLARLPGAG